MARSVFSATGAVLLLSLAAAAIASPVPTIRWNASLSLDGDGILYNPGSPMVGTDTVFAADNTNVVSIDRQTGAVLGTGVCSQNENCVMQPGGVAVGDFALVPKKDDSSTTIKAFNRSGDVAWSTVVPCQPSAFQAAQVSLPSDDMHVLITCEDLMNPTLIDARTGSIVTNATQQYQGLARASFVPADAAKGRSAMWLWSGAAGVVAFAHPSLSVVWSQYQGSYDGRPPAFSLERGVAYVYGDEFNVLIMDLSTGDVLHSASSSCNNGVQVFSDKYVTCFAPGFEHGTKIEIHSAVNASLLSTARLYNNCFGGLVPVPNHPDLAAAADCNHITIINLSDGSRVSSTRIESRYFTGGSTGFAAHVANDTVAYLTTLASVMAIEFSD